MPMRTTAAALLLLISPVVVQTASAETKDEAQKIDETFKIIDSMGLRTMLGIFGVALRETLSPTEPDTYIQNMRKALPGKSADAFIEFRKTDKFANIEASVADINEVALVEVDWLSPKAFGFTYLAVGTDGPVAIEIQADLAPKQKTGEVSIKAIRVHTDWTAISNVISDQQKLPAAITISGSFKK